MSLDRRALEAKGYLVVPGFVDLHAHLREPGFEDSETIVTGAKAALRGGFTTVCAMPNTEPAIDSPGLLAELIARGRSAGAARVLPIAAITRGRKKVFLVGEPAAQPEADGIDHHGVPEPGQCRPGPEPVRHIQPPQHQPHRNDLQVPQGRMPRHRRPHD